MKLAQQAMDDVRLYVDDTGETKRMRKRTDYRCPECQVGAMQPETTCYFTVQSGQPVSVPGFPAWVCDVCGRREYDSSALNQLRTMLKPSRTGRDSRHRKPKPQEQDQPGSSSDAQRRA